MRLGLKASLNMARICLWLGSSRPLRVAAGTQPFSSKRAATFAPRSISAAEARNRPSGAELGKRLGSMSTSRTVSYRVTTHISVPGMLCTGASSRSCLYASYGHCCTSTSNRLTCGSLPMLSLPKMWMGFASSCADSALAATHGNGESAKWNLRFNS